MIFGLQGTELGRDDDPIFIIPPILDRPVIKGPLTKDRREDLQILSFALAASLTDKGGHPLDIRPGGDPPDRIVGVHGRLQSVELTEFTISDVRQDLALARRLGRDLGERLRSNASLYSHLVGRWVH